MPAIKPHKTNTSDGPWDGPKNEANLKLDAPADYYKKAYAWYDPDKDPQTKAAYKFIHHEVDSEGNIGAANITACRTGIAVLNGARGGTTIPEEDYEGVWEHLASHLRDAGIEPPELKREGVFDSVEKRSINGQFEIREEDTGPKIVGYAAVFNRLSEPILWFREKIMPGAFREALKKSDVRALFNHDPNYVLGRTSNGTLKLYEDDKGLRYEIIPPNTQWARDLIESIKRGDINQSSFAFTIKEEKWNEDLTERTILSIETLYDVSVVTYPAYSVTEATVRSLDKLTTDDVTKSVFLLPIRRRKLELIQKQYKIEGGN